MTSTSVFPETVLALPCHTKALRRGALPEIHSSRDFHHPGVNLIMFMSVSPEKNPDNGMGGFEEQGPAVSNQDIRSYPL